jgi:diaminohydroxyphosphoribosylaminopyrimidine deaminase/5-amino-6-(5-phosphoribosylamino)uracil reductase
MQTAQEKWMSRAIFLAKLGLGKTLSNPLVGAVVVKNNRIIGEGFHHAFGGAHAEVEALKHLSAEDCVDAALYVTLEPCSHFGKTPPCADLILKKGIKKVYIGNVDPHPLVGGKGIEKLKQAGVEVALGILEEACKEMNVRFFTRLEKKRPYVILKWAQSLNGVMGLGYIHDPSKGKISNALTVPFTHRWRSEEQALLVGCNTIINDHPMLNVRAWTGKNPIIIILDPNGRIDGKQYKIFEGKTAKDIMVFSVDDKISRPEDFRILLKAEEFTLTNILSHLAQKDINSLMVEGGSKTIQQFLDASLWDEIRYFQSDSFLSGTVMAPAIKNAYLHEKITIANNTLYTFKPNE